MSYFSSIDEILGANKTYAPLVWRQPLKEILGINRPPAYVARSPLLHTATYYRVNDLLNNANRVMVGFGQQEFGLGRDYASLWRGLRSDPPRWSPAYETVVQQRTDAMQLVARELDRLPLFQGLNLAQQFRYEPWYRHLGPKVGAQTDMDTGTVYMGAPPFQSPWRLVDSMVHEGRHVWQRSFGGGYLEPTALGQADAYLFGLEHRHLYGWSPEMLAQNLGWFRRCCDVNDRLAAGLPVDARYTRPASEGGWEMSRQMDPVRRSELELRFSAVEPDLRRRLRGPEYDYIWARLPRTFSYQPWYEPSFLRTLGAPLLRGTR